MLLGAGLVSPFFPAATWFENVISFRARAIYWGGLRFVGKPKWVSRE
jgi:hypothetical protein